MIALLPASVGIRALGSQMAQCERECFLVRRIADRGINKNIGGSCVRGIEAFQHCRFAERGSGDDYLYPRSYRRFADRGNGNSDFCYDSPPVFDEYGDEEWYSWATGSSIIKDKVLYNRPEKIDEEDYMLVRKILKKSVLGDQLCAATGKQAARVRSPLDHSDFLLCGSTLMEARSDRRDCRLEHFTVKFSYPKLLEFVFDPEKHMSLNYNDECKIVPFDPGGFRWARQDSRTSLSKKGRMMQG